MQNYKTPFLWIDGERLGPDHRATMPVVNPSTGETLAKLPLADAEDLDRAVAAAQRGFHIWRATSAYDRAKILRRAAELLRERSDEIAVQMTLEQGKPLHEAKGEIAGTPDFLDWDADEGRRIYGRLIPSRVPHQRQMVMKTPIGPVATFTPWNYPFMIPVRKISSVLAAGCSCIIKPAEETPNSTLAIAEAFEDAGLPKGVLQVVFGVPAQVSQHLLTHAGVKGFAFTGSTAIGADLASLAARQVKRSVMELGGHAPILIFDDADIEDVAQLTYARKFRNGGQGCISPSRFYVQARSYDRFCDRVAELVGSIKVGDGFAPDTQMGPLAHERRVPWIEALIADAVSKGARLLCGGKRVGEIGHFITPAVLADVPDDARVMHEEPFGPLIALNSFTDTDDAIAKANATEFGLSAYCFTRDNATAIRVADEIEAGMIGINSFAVGAPTSIASPETPFGGMKASGYGSEGGIEGLEPYLDTKFVSQF
ncbi:NAD-dependent succinate-semialdehyde dehydrogenase [Novosphingobium sp. Leaf2]|uniref:NAD-dependent succinate-semialdehyde dehydrogenase n=1 Tax=Novosphingobium sp. Leaf2 TaxID=1735670 RepID=UPI0009EAE2A1|nr:NAD-dependent succinate-semialdehyde dehydrogenase [Novosphingobium sp. Leaf2]